MILNFLTNMLRLEIERIVFVLSFFAFRAKTASRVELLSFSGICPRLLLARSGPRVNVFVDAKLFGSLRQASGRQLRITVTTTEFFSWTEQVTISLRFFIKEVKSLNIRLHFSFQELALSIVLPKVIVAEREIFVDPSISAKDVPSLVRVVQFVP